MANDSNEEALLNALRNRFQSNEKEEDVNVMGPPIRGTTLCDDNGAIQRARLRFQQGEKRESVSVEENNALLDALKDRFQNNEKIIEIVIPIERGAQRAISRGVSKLRKVFDSPLYHNKTARENHFASHGQAATPFAHYASNRGGDWTVYANRLGFDRFRYTIGAYYGREETNEGIFSQIKYMNGGSRYIIPTVGDENPDILPLDVPFKLSPATLPENTGRDDQEGDILENLSFRQIFTVYAPKPGVPQSGQTAGQHVYPATFTDWTKYVEGGAWFVHGVDRAASVDLPPLINTGQTFQDFNFQFNLPLFPKEIRNVSNITKPLVAKISSDYVFYASDYEKFLEELKQAGRLNTRLLPNLYVFEFEKQSQNLSIIPKPRGGEVIRVGSILNRLITLENTMNRDGSLYFRDIFADPGNPLPGTKIGEEDRGDYFRDWPRAYRRFGLSDTEDVNFNVLSEMYENIIIDQQDMRSLSDANKLKYNFPMYIELEFSTDRNTLFSNALSEAQMMDPLVVSVFNNSRPGGEISEEPQRKNFHFATEYYSNIEPNEVVEKSTVLTENYSTLSMDFEDWIKKFKDDYEFIYDNHLSVANHVKLITAEESLFISSRSNSLARSIFMLILTDKVRNLVKQNMRTFEEILEGRPAYSETIAYCIKKFRSSGGGNYASTPDQTIYIPNNSELDIFNYIDTQVTYKDRYKYEVSAQQLVVGAEYNYSILSTTDGGNNFSSYVEVNLRPRAKIFEIPYFQTGARVLDHPPLFPNIQVVPYRGISNKILLLLDNQTGTIKDHPKEINLTEDSERFASLRSIQGIPLGAPITFEGDDPADFFEIYRLTKKPSSYIDFSSDNEYMTVNAMAGGFADTIVPNTKYYYTFRTVDIHGNISNPSPVYEIEMVEEDGAVFPLIKIVDFEIEKNTEPTQDFKRLLYLKPSTSQAVVIEKGNIGDNLLFSDDELGQNQYSPNLDSAENVEIKLGESEQDLFGSATNPKKFKIRISSKKTGRKMDLNVKFIHKHSNQF
jgi:hypothetical protein